VHRAPYIRYGWPRHSRERCLQTTSRDGQPLHARTPISRPSANYARPSPAGPWPQVPRHEPPSARPNVLCSASVQYTTPTFIIFCESYFITTGPPHPVARINQTGFFTLFFESTNGGPHTTSETAANEDIPSYALPPTSNCSTRNATLNQKQDTNVVLFDEDKPSLIPAKGSCGAIRWRQAEPTTRQGNCSYFWWAFTRFTLSPRYDDSHMFTSYATMGEPLQQWHGSHPWRPPPCMRHCCSLVRLGKYKDS
jgi:hypothetical protein